MADGIENYVAGGGVSAGIVAGLYIMYKCCYRKKVRSKCCGGELDVSNEPVVQQSPVYNAVVAKDEPERLEL
jgi:hypothetical protein